MCRGSAFVVAGDAFARLLYPVPTAISGAYGPDGSKLQLTNAPVNDTTTNETQYGTNLHGDVENLTVADGSAKSTYRYTA